MNEKKLLTKIRRTLIVFIICLVVSGTTAFPIETELQFIQENFTFLPDFVKSWIADVYLAIKSTNTNFPFLSYGFDWLAFAHIVIAISFIGPIRNPVKNVWVIEFGMIACLLVIPLALIAGSVRGIPLYWRLIDCSFGVVGLIPLTLCFQWIKKLESLHNVNHEAR